MQNTVEVELGTQCNQSGKQHNLSTQGTQQPATYRSAKINQLHSQPMLKNTFILYLPINVFLQADGTVRGGAATERVQCSTATFPVSLTFGLELPGLHFFQCLHSKPVHGILQQKKENKNKIKKKATLLHNRLQCSSRETPRYQINVSYQITSDPD